MMGELSNQLERTTMTELQQHLESLAACDEAKEWSKDLTAVQAWETCTCPDWLLWWAARTNVNSKQSFVIVTCQIARTVLKYVPYDELRPLQAIEAAEKYIDNPTKENKKNLARAAYAARVAYAAYAAAYAARVAYAAEAAVYAAEAAEAVARAPHAAEAAEAVARAPHAAARAAYAAARAEQCTIIRKYLKQPWIETSN